MEREKEWFQGSKGSRRTESVFGTLPKSKTEIFLNKVNGWKPLTIITKSSILDAWPGSEYTCGLIKFSFTSIFYFILQCLFYNSSTSIFKFLFGCTAKNTVISTKFLVWKLGEVTVFFAVMVFEIFFGHSFLWKKKWKN